MKYSGYYLVATGVIHNLIGLMMGWSTLVEMHQAGWFASTVSNGEMLFNREAITWFLLTGSFWILFGLTLQKVITEGFTPPKSLALGLIIISTIIAIIMPISGAYLIILQGIILYKGISNKQQRLQPSLQT